MADISIKQTADFPTAVFEVRVKDQQETTHEVTLREDYYKQLLKGGDIPPKQLIEYSFQFLLAHEPNTSILPEFDLEQINDYFKEYERQIRPAR